MILLFVHVNVLDLLNMYILNAYRNGKKNKFQLSIEIIYLFIPINNFIVKFVNPYILVII